METNAKIKVVGIGGSGSNAVSRMKKCNIKSVELIAINADAQDLIKTRADIKIRIGRKITQGLGAGMDPEVGKLAAEEQKEEIQEALKGADMTFVVYGAGGGTGTGAGPVVAEVARSSGSLTVAVITRPFSFEGIYRQKVAQSGIRRIKEKVDSLIVISNDRLLEVLDPQTTIVNAFWACDEILRQAVQGLSDLITLPGIVNVDFADVKAIMQDSGTALFGVGYAQGENRAAQAAKAAIKSPLLDVSPRGAKGVLFNASGGGDISLSEINEVGKIITEEISPEAKVIFGAVQDEKLKKGELKVTVIATGF